MRAVRISIALAIVIGSASACGSGHSKPPRVTVTGTVLDARTGKPLPAAILVANGVRAPLDAAGRFTVGQLPKTGVQFAATAKNYHAAAAAEPIAKPFTLTIRMTPLAVTVTTFSNLTGKRLATTVTAAGKRAKAVGGAVSVFGAGPGDKVSAAAAGYANGSATVGADRRVSVTLVAGAVETVKRFTALDIAQRWDTEYQFVHTDVRSVITQSDFVATNKQYIAQGAYTQSRAIHSFTMQPSWNYSGCAGGVGARTYHNVAAVEYTEVDSAAGGNSTSVSGIMHLVQMKNGLWGFFPVTNACPA